MSGLVGARYVPAWQLGFAKVWLACWGQVRHGSWGVTGSGSDRHVMVRQLRFVKVWSGLVWYGEVGYGSYGKLSCGEVWSGKVCYGPFWQLRFVRVS